MDVELITIGDEILTGHTVNTNAAFIADKLTGVGFEIKYMSTTGDSLEQMEEAFRLALKRAHLIITTGGLGPTEDDITKKAIVKVFKRNLVFHEDILEDMKERFARRGIVMPASNHSQALLPQGAKFFPNKSGQAVGICIAEDDRIFISLPGVPREMEQIMVDEVIPYVKGLDIGQALKIVKLRTTGVAESKLADMLEADLKLEDGVKLAYLPAYHGVDLRIIAVAESEDEAVQKARTVERFLESMVGKYIYGKDDDTLQGVVGQLLKDNDKTLAVAESCSGGQLGMIITSVPGSSTYFLGGIVSYANDAKINQLSVDPNIIEEHGAVSEQCAVAMATGCRQRFECDYALSITGIAGPEGGTDEKPVGTTYIGLASAHTAFARKFSFGRNRESNRARASYAALELLRRDILDIQ
ncbi:MAG: competence/damage-inducible protein A [Candidatus Zixiibacteriota bacterium]|nr:MAG: competence/damage-inducible protein A [candidate division Zixibacteria bacterium]